VDRNEKLDSDVGLFDFAKFASAQPTGSGNEAIIS